MADTTHREGPDVFSRHTPVKARVRVDPGQGALWGFAAGAASAGAPELVAAATQVAEGLMARGLYHGGPAANPAAALAATVPLALFHGGADDQRIETILSLGGTLETRLALVGLAGALAALTFRGEAGEAPFVAAVGDIDTASEALRDANETVEDEVIAANTALRTTLGGALEEVRPASDGTLSGALAVACWHLLDGGSLGGALEGLDGLSAALVGAVAGAKSGRAALPQAWMQAAETVAVKPLADFVLSGPFLGWGIPRQTG